MYETRARRLGKFQLLLFMAEIPQLDEGEVGQRYSISTAEDREAVMQTQLVYR